MGALGDVIDRFNTFPTPVKILVVGGIGVAGYLGYKHYASGAGTSSTSGSSGTIPLDLAPQGTTDNLTANGPGTGSGTGTGTTTGTTSTGGTATSGGGSASGSTGTATGTGHVTSGGTSKSGGGGHKTPVKKPVVSKPKVHAPTVEHIKETAKATKHPNIGYGTKEPAKHIARKVTAAGPNLGKLN